MVADAHDGMGRYEAAVNAVKLVLEFFLAGIDQNLGPLAEYQLFYFEKAP